MIELLFGAAVLCMILALPILLLGVFFRVFFHLLLLPFQLIGGLLHVLFAGAGALLKVFLGVVVAVVTLVFLPLLPLLLLGVLVWGFVKLLQPAQVVVR